MKRLLLVDDNQKYATLLTDYFSKRGYEIDTAVTAGEGLDMFKKSSPDYYSVIVTDITMESQLAGLTMLSKIKKIGFSGTIVVASTGFDVPTVIPLSRLLLKSWCGVDFLVRKTTVLKEDPEFWSMKFFTAPRKSFEEILPVT